MSLQHLSARATAPTSKVPEAKEPPKEVLNQTFDDIEVDNTTSASEAVKNFKPEQLPERKPTDGKSINDTPSESVPNSSTTKGEEGRTNVQQTEEVREGEATAPTSERAGAEATTSPQRKRSEAERGEVSQQISAEPKGRDYTGFSDEEQAVLKKMSNNSFAFATKLIKENKELKSRTDGVYYQHNEGYTLDPQYKQLQTDAWYADQEGKYWESQLYAMQEGQEWTPLVGYNQDGTFKFGEKRQPTPRDVEQVRRAMNECVTAKQRFVGQTQALQQNYNARVQQDAGIINQEQAKRFAWVADPKQLESTIDIPGVGEKSIGQIRQEFTNLFPTYHRGHIAVDVASNLFAALQIYGARIRELESRNKVSEIKREEVIRGEPKSEVKPQPKGKAVGGITSFDMDDFKV